jgi:DNA-directed RNA polymerase specialized sigma24 family protein
VHRPPDDGWIGPHHGIMAAGRSGMSGSGRPDGWRPPIERERAAHGGWAPAVDERAIVDAVLRGDREAFRGLVEREADGLVRACARVLGDHAEAEDAAQEAFVTAYRSLASWRGEGPFGAWLTRIGIRVALRMASRRRTVAWRHPGGERPTRASATDVLDAAARAAAQAADRDALAASPLTDPALMSIRAERASEIRASRTARSSRCGSSPIRRSRRSPGRPGGRSERSRPTCIEA